MRDRPQMCVRQPGETVCDSNFPYRFIAQILRHLEALSNDLVECQHLRTGLSTGHIVPRCVL